MNIRQDAKKIISFFLEQSIEKGDLFENYVLNFETLAQTLDLQNSKYCRVCCQYLAGSNFVELRDKENGSGIITLHSAGIDFLEKN